MENKSDIISLSENDGDLHICVNDVKVIELNKNNNKIDTKKIYEKLNLCDNYVLEINICDEPKNKELFVLHKYTKEFLTKLKDAINAIDYNEINEQLDQ